jgi:hypothetical protein
MMPPPAAPVAWPPLERDVRLLAALMDVGRGENGLTEFLASLLRHPLMMRAFLTDVLGLHVSQDLLATTIVSSEDDRASLKGVPDISIRAGDALFVLVENKLGAPFTDNQPHEYMRSLQAWKDERPDGRAMLVVQAPDSRIAALTEETWRALGERIPDRPKTGTAHGGVEVRIVSWSDTGKTLAGLSVEEPVASYLLRSFLHLLPIALESTSRVVTEEHLMKLNDKTVLEAFAAVEDVLHDVGVKLRKTYEVKTSKDHLDFTFCGFEVYPRLANGKRDEDANFSVALSARFGARFGVSPLSVTLGAAYDRTDALRQAGWRVIPGADVAVFEWSDLPTVPLKLIAELDPVRQAERVVAEIEEILRIARR